MINAKKVAEIAGVSRSTVQRALTDHPNVNMETRNKIIALAESLGYKPNKTAKALVMRQYKLKYGVIFTSRNNPFYQEELRGINSAIEELTEYGIDIKVLFMSEIDVEEQAKIIDDMVLDGTKGIVMVALDSDQVRKSVQNGIKKGVHFITITSDVESTDRLCYVGWDHYKGGRVAGGMMKWLVPPCGKIGIIIGSHRFRAHRKRMEGFISCFSEDRPEHDILEILENEDDSVYSETLVEEFLTKNTNVKGLFITGAGVSGACRGLIKMGKSKDIKVICFDRVESHISLCKDGIIDVVIDQEPFEQGYRAIKILNNFVMFGEVPEDQYFTRIDIRTRENIDL